MRVLVVGATGQLGTAVVRKLQAGKLPVRAFVRSTSSYQHLKSGQVELAFGDLRDADSVDRACAEVNAVIATAGVVFPRGSYSFEHDEGKGYKYLIDACRRHAVRQLVFMSVPEKTPHDRKIPTFQFKRSIENMIQCSGISYTVFRGAVFMDDYFALMGSTLPLREAEAASLRRPFWFSRYFVKSVSTLIDKWGIAVVPAHPDSRHAFIAIDDVAQYLVNALDHPEAQNSTFDIGGPEILSWRDVAEIYSNILNRRVRVFQIPSLLSHFGFLTLRAVSQAAANQMGLYWILAKSETLFNSEEVSRTFGVHLTSAEKFLSDKNNLPAIHL